jgi:chromosomal replication initiation ATPase DnaA
MVPSYYVFPGLKLAYLTPEQLEGIKRQNLVYFKSNELINEIMNCVCEFFSVTKEQIEGKRGKGILPWARHVFNYMCKKYSRLTLKGIGDLINRDHTTVMHSLKTVQGNMDSYPEYKEQVLFIDNKISDRIYTKVITIKTETPQA